MLILPIMHILGYWRMSLADASEQTVLRGPVLGGANALFTVMTCLAEQVSFWRHSCGFHSLLHR